MTHSTYSHCLPNINHPEKKTVSYRTNVGTSSMRTNWTSLDMNKAPPWQVHWHRLLESIQRSLQWKPTRTKVQQFAIKGASNVLKPRAGWQDLNVFFWMHFDGFKTLDWKNKGQKMNQLQLGGWISNLANGICDRFFTTWVSTKKPDPGHQVLYYFFPFIVVMSNCNKHFQYLKLLLMAQILHHRRMHEMARWNQMNILWNPTKNGIQDTLSIMPSCQWHLLTL